MKITLINDDSVKALNSLPDNHIDCVVTSPPYDDLRTYGGYNTWDFEGTARELYRVLKPGGVICWNVNDGTDKNGSKTGTSYRQLLFFMEIGFNYHDCIIYKKKNASHPPKHRYRQETEWVFILTKGKPKTFNPISDRKNKTAGKVGCFGRNTFTNADGTKSERKKKIVADYGLRGNVWEGNTRGQEDCCQPQDDHPAKMPRWLARDLIISYSNEGDLVADPFAGSGTTLIEGRNLDRNILGIDIDPKCVETQKKELRLNEQLDTGMYEIEIIGGSAEA